MLFQQHNGVFPAIRKQYLVPIVFQGGVQQLANSWLIIDDKD
jgi:hypothetical protein